MSWRNAHGVPGFERRNHGLRAPDLCRREGLGRKRRTLTTDGPFAETREQLAGLYLLSCEDLDEAIAWAARIPSAGVGTVEIRPVHSGVEE